MISQIEATKRFISKALALHNEHANETIVRDNFTSFLRNMFPDNPKWVNDHINGAERRAHLLRDNRQIIGYIDNCIDSIAIEYEKNLTIPAIREEGFRQVKEYCASLVRENIPMEMILGILSDTLHWHVYEIEPNDNLNVSDYTQDNINLKEIAYINIDDCSERSCKDLLQFLQKYLGRQGGRKLTAKRLAEDFGLRSNYSELYRDSIRNFVLNKISDNHAYYSFIEELWSKFVKKHSSEKEDIEVYINEYYISIIGKILCANLILKEALSSNDAELLTIINGEFFEDKNILNFVDYDYFGWLNSDAEAILSIIRMIQDDLKVYDFQILPEEDMFGELMVQLSNRTQRVLLGQDLTPNWLASQIVSNVVKCLPKGEYPQFVDMCCGSGSMIVETIKHTIKLIPTLCDKSIRNQIIKNCISGFDIDPLAVILAKINWIVNVYNIIEQDSSIFIPIYHADSLFAENLMTKKVHYNNEEKVMLQLLDKEILMPSYLVSFDDSDIFDTIVNKCYDCIKYKIDYDRFIIIIKEVLNPLVYDEDKLNELSAFSYDLYKSLYELNCEGKNGIWAFILKNSFRPCLISARYNGIVTNTPWLAMSKIGSNPYKDSLKAIAKDLGINPADSSFPHLEMATVFLLSSITRFLKEGGLFGCILPDSVLTGSQHNKFRKGDFKNKNIKASFSEIWELPANTFNNRSIAIFGNKEEFKERQSYPGKRYTSKDSISDIVFNVSKLSSKVIWTSEMPEGGTIAEDKYSFNQGADIMPRCFIFFTNHISNTYVQISSIKANDDYSYFLKDQKIGKDLSYSFNRIPLSLFKSVLISHILTPFSIGTPPLGLLPIKKKDGVWTQIEDTDYLVYPRSTLNLLRTIKNDYNRLTGDNDMYEKYVNYRNKLVQQVFEKGKYLVVFGASGANICAAYLQIDKPDDIVIDQTIYWTIVETEDEALYLSAILNSPALNKKIDSFQPQGIFGKRHIHTLPKEFIPKYDNKNPDHITLITCTRKLIFSLKINTDIKWLNPNNGPIAYRRRKIVQAMKELPLFDSYSSICNKILRNNVRNHGDASPDPFL